MQNQQNHFSSIGSLSGKFIRSMGRSTPEPSSRLTEAEIRCLSDIAPRAFAEAMRQHALLRVMAEAWSRPVISGALVVRTIFSTLTQESRYRGQALLRSAPGSRLFRLNVSEVAVVSEGVVLELQRLAKRADHLAGASIYHVLTLQEIIQQEALQLPGL